MAERRGAGDLGARRLAGAADGRNDHRAVAPPQIVVTDADRHGVLSSLARLVVRPQLWQTSLSEVFEAKAPRP